MGQQVFLHAHDVDIGKLQSLGGMQSHQLHLIVDVFLFLAFQKVAQDQLVDGSLDVLLALIVILGRLGEALLQLFKQQLHIGDGPNGGRLRVAGLLQPALEVHVGEHFANGGDAVAALRLFADVGNPLRKLRQP